MIDHSTLARWQREAEQSAWQVGYLQARLRGAREDAARKEGDRAVTRVRKALGMRNPGGFLRRLLG